MQLFGFANFFTYFFLLRFKWDGKCCRFRVNQQLLLRFGGRLNAGIYKTFRRGDILVMFRVVNFLERSLYQLHNKMTCFPSSPETFCYINPERFSKGGFKNRFMCITCTFTMYVVGFGISIISCRAVATF